MKSFIILLAIVGIVAATWIADFAYHHTVASDLKQQAENALAHAGHSDVEVEFNRLHGRIGRSSAPVTNEILEVVRSGVVAGLILPQEESSDQTQEELTTVQPDIKPSPEIVPNGSQAPLRESGTQLAPVVDDAIGAGPANVSELPTNPSDAAEVTAPEEIDAPSFPFVLLVQETDASLQLSARVPNKEAEAKIAEAAKAARSELKINERFQLDGGQESAWNELLPKLVTAFLQHSQQGSRLELTETSIELFDLDTNARRKIMSVFDQ